MTGSWTMDYFIIGCILLVAIPAVYWVYKEMIQKERGA